MLDIRKALVTALKTVQTNVQYELAVESPVLPLITYKSVNDSVLAYGDNLGYSDVLFQIKVWADSVSDIAELTEDIDAALKPMGLTRSYYNELSEGSVIIGVMQYKGLIKEEFN